MGPTSGLFSVLQNNHGVIANAAMCPAGGMYALRVNVLWLGSSGQEKLRQSVFVVI